MPTPRDPRLRSYRVAVYVVFSLLGAIASALILRSVVGDLFGRGAAGATPKVTAAACLDEVDHLLSAISARAAQPTSQLGSAGAALEWDRWSRRWEDELAAASDRCGSDAHLAAALDGLESLRRELNRGGEATAREALRVREQLDAARDELKRKPRG